MGLVSRESLFRKGIVSFDQSYKVMLISSSYLILSKPKIRFWMDTPFQNINFCLLGQFYQIGSQFLPSSHLLAACQLKSCKEKHLPRDTCTYCPFKKEYPTLLQVSKGGIYCRNNWDPINADLKSESGKDANF